jgi:hypothetical protein
VVRAGKMRNVCRGLVEKNLKEELLGRLSHSRDSMNGSNGGDGHS